MPDEPLTPQLVGRRASDSSAPAAEPSGSAASATALGVSDAAREADRGGGGTQPLPTNADGAAGADAAAEGDVAGQQQVIAAPLGARACHLCVAHMRHVHL